MLLNPTTSTTQRRNLKFLSELSQETQKEVESAILKLNPYSFYFREHLELTLCVKTRSFWPKVRNLFPSHPEVDALRSVAALIRWNDSTMALLIRSLMANADPELVRIAQSLTAFLRGEFEDYEKLLAGMLEPENSAQRALRQFGVRFQLAAFWANGSTDIEEAFAKCECGCVSSIRQLEEWLLACRSSGCVLKRIPVEVLWVISPRYFLNRSAFEVWTDPRIASQVFLEKRAVREEKVAFLNAHRSKMLKDFGNAWSWFGKRRPDYFAEKLEMACGPLFRKHGIRNRSLARRVFNEISYSRYAFDEFACSTAPRQDFWDYMPEAAKRQIRNIIPGQIAHSEYASPDGLLKRIDSEPGVRWHIDPVDMKRLLRKASPDVQELFIRDFDSKFLFDVENPLWSLVPYKEMIRKKVSMYVFRHFGIPQIKTHEEYIRFRRFCYRDSTRSDYLWTFNGCVSGRELP